MYDSYELAMAALCTWREAQGESQEARNGVAAVIRNRAAKKGMKLDQVVLAPLQFSSFNHSDPNSTKFPRRILTAEWQAYQECAAAIDSADVTGGATHYFDDSISPPSWVAAMTFKVKIGRLSFYQDPNY